MFVVGLTGGIGSGKSTVADEFRKLGIVVVDADQASRAVVEPGSSALKKIADHFGNGSLTPAGQLDRAWLRQRVFSDREQRRWLEKLLHPLIEQWLGNEIGRAGSPYVILESPLLLETSQRRRTDRILVVDVPEAIQLARTMARDANSESLVKSIIASQMPREERLARADDLIDNTCSLEELQRRVGELHQLYLEISAGREPGAHLS